MSRVVDELEPTAVVSIPAGEYVRLKALLAEALEDYYAASPHSNQWAIETEWALTSETDTEDLWS